MTEIVLIPSRGGSPIKMVTDIKRETSLKTRVLIVAPDSEEGRRLEHSLTAAEGFETVFISYEAAVGTDVRCMRPSMILLVILEDERPGFLTLRHLRHAGDLPIVICSQRDSEHEIIRALESGANEYLILPLEPPELAARLHAVLRRWGPRLTPFEGKVLRAGDLELHLNERRAFRNGEAIDLTPIEFRLLLALVRRPGQLVSHDQLLTEVWGPQYTDCPHYVRLYMRYLRVKIEDDPHAPTSLISEWGMGYRFEPREPTASQAGPVRQLRDSMKRGQRAAGRQGVADGWFSPAGQTAHP